MIVFMVGYSTAEREMVLSAALFSGT